MSISIAEVISEIESEIHSIKQNTALFDEKNFSYRTNTLDYIDFYIISRIEGLLQNAEPEKKLQLLKRSAEKAKHKLEKIDTRLFKQLRKMISDGIFTNLCFAKMVSKHMGYDVDDIKDTVVVGYNNLDIFINGLLSAQDIPPATKDLEPEMVFFQKTPAVIVFRMVALAQFRQGDVFFDLGSGLGQVAMMVNLIARVTAIGVEYEPAYCNYAKTCASQLNLNDVDFINTDARQADYSHGTVFFMYTPFSGGVLQDMLKILQMESIKRTITIFTYGPCSPEVAAKDWLNCINGNAADPHQLCEFKSVTPV